MKTCPRCKETKPLQEFFNRRGKEGGSAYCKLCNKAAVIERTQANKKLAVAHFGGGCKRCGYNKCLRALHFHHPNPILKDDLFHRLRNRKIGVIITTLEEQKCELLCSNCHFEEHCESC